MADALVGARVFEAMRGVPMQMFSLGTLRPEPQHRRSTSATPTRRAGAFTRALFEQAGGR